jgi:hypothetical protein
MKRFLTLLGLGLTGLVLVFGCHKGPQDGDTITPALQGRPHWVAGQPGSLQVRLRAASADGGVRDLDFSGIAAGANPSAAVTFYEGDRARPPVHVILDHRC